MPFQFNMLLAEANIDPAGVRLLRHQPLVGGRSLLDVWRADRKLFENFQEIQAAGQRSRFLRPYWASFIGTWDGRTLFSGLYAVERPVTIETSFVAPLSGMQHEAGTFDRYVGTLVDAVSRYEGRLYVDWGGGASGKRAWTQRAEAQNKMVTELHLTTAERPFPGMMALTEPLSALDSAPPTWIDKLSAARGVYLLACPRDGSQYVGSATAAGGFWSRWVEYRANGHGGNVALIGREPSDFIVSVLQVAGSAETAEDILAAEAIWKAKLQTRSLGLNRN